jgi:hypothetical protein
MSSSRKWLITLGISAAIVLGYAAGLVAHRPRTRSASQPSVPELKDQVGQPLPAVDLIGVDRTRLDDASLRKGKVMLVLLTTGCDACKLEGEFLRTVVDKRKDVNFYGVMSFEQNDAAAKLAETLFPFKVYRDAGRKLANTLHLGHVPIKIYLEDGVIKRSWDGATVDEQAKDEFTRWLTDLN